MNEWDQMVNRMVEADGVRMASGQHIDQPAPHTRHRLITKCGTCGITGGHMVTCPDKYDIIWDDDRPDADPWVDRNDHYER